MEWQGIDAKNIKQFLSDCQICQMKLNSPITEKKLKRIEQVMIIISYKSFRLKKHRQV